MLAFRVGSRAYDASFVGLVGWPWGFPVSTYFQDRVQGVGLWSTSETVSSPGGAP